MKVVGRIFDTPCGLVFAALTERQYDNDRWDMMVQNIIYLPGLEPQT